MNIALIKIIKQLENDMNIALIKIIKQLENDMNIALIKRCEATTGFLVTLIG